MNISVETFMVVSLAFAVFAAVTAVGAAIMLSVGYERLRSGLIRMKEGLDMVSKQTGFFSDAIHRLDEKVSAVDTQTQRFSSSLDSLQGHVDRVDKQTGFFSDSLRQLETKIREVEDRPKPIDLKNLMANPLPDDKEEDKKDDKEAPEEMLIVSSASDDSNRPQARAPSFLDQVTGKYGNDIHFH